jgi:predicted XRE-type DNA-binding protein
MSGGYVISVDPYEMANRFSFQEPMFSDECESFDDLDSSVMSMDDMEDQLALLLDKIPEREADLIQLYYIQKKRQSDIAEIFGVTQAAISYRLSRGIQRIKFLLSIPCVTEEDLRKDLPLVPLKRIDVDILVGIWKTTCQSDVATKLRITQGRVRHRFFIAVEQLRNKAEKDAKFEPYNCIFTSIANKRFNILKEVKLPQWSGRGGNNCF